MRDRYIQKNAPLDLHDKVPLQSRLIRPKIINQIDLEKEGKTFFHGNTVAECSPNTSAM